MGTHYNLGGLSKGGNFLLSSLFLFLKNELSFFVSCLMTYYGVSWIIQKKKIVVTSLEVNKLQLLEKI